MNAFAINDDVIAIRLNRSGEGTVDAITLEQQRVRLCISKIVDRNKLKPAIRPFEDRARNKATDTSKTIATPI
jgi:hypothetical protein